MKKLYVLCAIVAVFTAAALFMGIAGFVRNRATEPHPNTTSVKITLADYGG